MIPDQENKYVKKTKYLVTNCRARDWKCRDIYGDKCLGSMKNVDRIIKGLGFDDLNIKSGIITDATYVSIEQPLSVITLFSKATYDGRLLRILIVDAPKDTAEDIINKIEMVYENCRENFCKDL